MSATKIEWATHVWNPVTGCTKVSEGCRNCYAERVVKRFGERVHGLDQVPSYPDFIGPGDAETRAFTDVAIHPDRLDQPLRWRKPRRVFVCSMSDLFHKDAPDDFLDAVFAAMALSVATFMVLTKRPARMLKYVSSVHAGKRTIASTACHDVLGRGFIGGLACADWITRGCPNLWLGVSVENQATADERIPLLLQTPAAVRFVSCEPMLGAVDLDGHMTTWRCDECGEAVTTDPRWRFEGRDWAHHHGYPVGHVHATKFSGLDWVICGGESGPGARPCEIRWIESIVDQCRAAGVPAFVKQLGADPRWSGAASRPTEHARGKNADPGQWPDALRVREVPNA